MTSPSVLVLDSIIDITVCLYCMTNIKPSLPYNYLTSCLCLNSNKLLYFVFLNSRVYLIRQYNLAKFIWFLAKKDNVDLFYSLIQLICEKFKYERISH
jgi:hypothetical protein